MTGDKIGDYHDSLNEKLVAVVCRYNDTRLKNFNLVNKTITEIENNLGKPDSISTNKLFYLYTQEVLCLKTEKNKVTSFYWFKSKNKLNNDTTWKNAMLNFS